MLYQQLQHPTPGCYRTGAKQYGWQRTRIVAAIGTRGFATTVQYDLGNNGANGLYSATMGSSGCPSFTSIASNANGFVFGNQVTGSAYPTGAPMNAGSRQSVCQYDDRRPARSH